MSTEENHFNETGLQIEGAVKGQLFGKSCFKMGKKAFVCFFQDCMVFKLNQPYHAEALELSGAILFDPSGKNRPMKEWVQIPFEHVEKWATYSEHSRNYILSIT